MQDEPATTTTAPTQNRTKAASRLAAVSVLVPDYDQAIAFYRGTLGFTLLEDTTLDDGDDPKRWVRVAPPGGGCCLLLARAATPSQRAAIGEQAGGRVFLFLETDNFARDYAAFQASGVCFTEEPRTERYGVVAVFKDPYGNRWDLIEPAAR